MSDSQAPRVVHLSGGLSTLVVTPDRLKDIVVRPSPHPSEQPRTGSGAPPVEGGAQRSIKPNRPPR